MGPACPKNYSEQNCKTQMSRRSRSINGRILSLEPVGWKQVPKESSKTYNKTRGRPLSLLIKKLEFLQAVRRRGDRDVSFKTKDLRVDQRKCYIEILRNIIGQ
jgi:hypothetical protein